MFEVSGWSAPSAPVVTTNTGSRKRKRAAIVQEDQKVQAATVNLEKLMLGIDSYLPKKQKSGKQGAPSEKTAPGFATRKSMTFEKKKREGTRQPKIESSKPVDQASQPRAKSKDRSKRRKDRTPERRAEASTTPLPSQLNGLTELQSSMKNSLEGARFRYINELLYKSASEDAVRLANEDPSMIDDYHIGFRHQVKSWPANPVDQYISELSRLPLPLVVADLGCGDAAVARELVPKGICVLSFDLKSDGKYIVEADICQRLPLPGSADPSESGTGAIVDIVICALSLMSTNWLGCIREAWRVLKRGGHLKIAEVTSRFKEVSDFVELVTLVGFKLKSKDESNTHFVKFEFVRTSKAKTAVAWSDLAGRSKDVLKPCEYRRR